MLGLFDNHNAIKNAKIQLIGALVQGLYVYYSCGKIDSKFFIIYLLLTFMASIFYYKVFLSD